MRNLTTASIINDFAELNDEQRGMYLDYLISGVNEACCSKILVPTDKYDLRHNADATKIERMFNFEIKTILSNFYTSTEAKAFFTA